MLPKSARVWRCARHARQTNVATAIAATTDPMSQPWDIREYSPIAGTNTTVNRSWKFPMTTWRSGSLRCPRALSRDSGGRRPKAVLGDPRAGAAPARSGTGPVPHRVAGLRHPGRAGLPYDLRRRRTASVINPNPRAEGRWIQPDATTGLRMMLRRARQRDADRLSRGINRPPRNTASIVL